jgi:diaminohydroxyphosphoribosylaminopyrimidine deaminase / 5-amino-6-(5-phosphoribosylamino)uracil reductase
MISDIDRKWMLKAIRLSRQYIGKTSPNPPVGCLIVNHNSLVGSGVHCGPGSPHAEVNAIHAATPDMLKGATCYVTLEPCNHWGRTPPCTEAIIQSGIRRVVIALKDCNPMVRGGGIERLRSAGLTVDTGILPGKAFEVLAPWMVRTTTGKPFVIYKSAMSTDGHVATCSGESRWISCQKSRRYVHKIRRTVSGIMVGAGTVLNDNPELTARKKEKTIASPTRIIIDQFADVTSDYNVFKPETTGRTIWVVSKKHFRKAKSMTSENVRILPVSERSPGLDLEYVMQYLAQEESMESVLLEGGPTLAFSMIDQNLVHKIVFFIAPILIGGTNAPSILGGKGFNSIDSARRINNFSVRRFGEDMLLEGYLESCPCLQAS